MKRAASLLALLSIVGCDLSQELQGDADGGSSGGPSPTATSTSSTPPPTPTPPGSDGGTTDGGPKGPVSVCVPQAAMGQAKVLVDGSENPYMNDVSDIAFTASRVFVLSTPWAFVGAPYGGGAVESYSMSATLPSYVGFAIGAPKAFAAGSRTTQEVGGGELPSGGGHVFALRGSTSSASDRAGEIVLDGNDLVFWKRSPSAVLVQSSLSGGAERIVAEYTSVSNVRITAVALDATDIWFTTQESSGATVSNARLHRTPRAGGPVEDVVALPVTSESMTPGGILFDGSTVYMPPVPYSEFMLAHVKGTSSVTYATLGDKATRSSPVAFDGAYFYWTETTNGQGCPGMLKRKPKSLAFGSQQTLLTNLDRGVRIAARGGAVYVGTAAEPFRKPATRGQLIEWRP